MAFEAILILMVPTKRGFFDWEPALAYTVVIMLALSPAALAGRIRSEGVIRNIIAGYILRMLMIPSQLI